MQEKDVAWVVCCEPRIVLFGYAPVGEQRKKRPVLKRVRMLVYWDAATKGVHGAAAIGPTNGCRVTPAAPEQAFDTKVEAWIRCSDAAIDRWEAAPWAG